MTVTTFSTDEYEGRTRTWSDIQPHLPFLKAEASKYEHPVIIELGVRAGYSTAAFLAAAEECGGELWSVDIAETSTPEHWRGIIRWHLLIADDLSEKAQGWLPAECDVLFIDSGHAYEHTLKELNAYAPRVRSGGVILMHDTEWEPGPDGTENGCRQLSEPGGPVTKAISEYCEAHGLTWANRTGSYGIGIIRV